MPLTVALTNWWVVGESSLLTGAAAVLDLAHETHKSWGADRHRQTKVPPWLDVRSKTQHTRRESALTLQQQPQQQQQQQQGRQRNTSGAYYLHTAWWTIGCLSAASASWVLPCLWTEYKKIPSLLFYSSSRDGIYAFWFPALYRLISRVRGPGALNLSFLFGGWQMVNSLA